MKKLVIFDLDGTLVNTIADLAEATNYALRQHGYPTYPIDTIRGFVGNGINKLLERSLPESFRTEEQIRALRKDFTEYYDKHHTDLTEPYPQIKETLEWIQNNSIELAVASNKYQEATEKIVKHYFPDIEFLRILGQRNNIPTKPDPTIVNEIAEYANIEKKDILYVGDSGVDMQTAINAKVEYIGVSWGFRSREELEKFRPLAIIDSACQLKEILRAINIK